MMNGAYVSLGGVQLNDALLMQASVTQRLNDHWFCEIKCRSPLDQPIPGAEALGVSLALSHTGEDGVDVVSFVGTVVQVDLKKEVWGSESCVLLAASASWGMDRSKRFAHFDGSVSSVAGGMGASSSLEDKGDGREFVQFDETNWQFLLRIADDHGGWIRSGLGDVELLNEFDAAVPLMFREHAGLLEFSIEGDLAAARVAAAHYDAAVFRSQIFAGEQKSPTFEAAGQKMGGAVASGSAALGLLGFAERSRSWSLSEMQQRAQADAERAQGGAITGAGQSRCLSLNAGGAVTLSGLGEADGTWYLTEVTHVWNRKEYVNEFKVTPWKVWRAPQPPPVRRATGVQVGRVVSNVDAAQRGRLTVSLFWQDGGSLLPAPMASLHCGAGFGLTVMPEVGDEVLVGFTDGDPERPVILGCLWNGVQQPPRDQFATGNESQDNLVKRLVTKAGSRIHIVDTPGMESMVLATPRSNRLILSEKVAETGRPAIAMETQGDIHFRAAGRIHEKASFHTTHVDGKIMHSAQVSIADIYGNTKPFETTPIEATLSDGSSFEGMVGAGQAFHSIPPGTNKFGSSKFYVERPADAGDEDA